jgi:Uma2 family endonuclease
MRHFTEGGKSSSFVAAQTKPSSFHNHCLVLSFKNLKNMAATLVAEKDGIRQSPAISKEVLEALIYEIDEGQPIYYRGYQDVLSGKLTLDDIMRSSRRQSIFVGEIFIIISQLRRFFYAFTSELGIKFKNSERAADIAFFHKSRMTFEEAMSEHCADSVPDIIIEVDIKANVKDLESAKQYYIRKTRQLLDNGGQKVIWVFTKSKTILVAEAGKEWEMKTWEETIEVSHGIGFNMLEIMESLK